MLFTIITAGALLFLISLLWYIWTGRLMQGERASLRGARAGPAVPLAEEVAPPPTLTRGERKARPAAKLPAKQLIRREFRVTYNRRIYVHKVFHLDVVIAPEAQKLPELTAQERRRLKEAVRERLEFEAPEREPLVQVTLKCDEDDFEILEPAQTRRLSRERETRFTFRLKPLKAEDCPITVIISFLQEVDVPEEVRTVEIVETVEEGASGVSRSRMTRRAVTPARRETVTLPVKAIPLVVEVKSLWRLSASDLSLLQKALGPVVVILLLAIALLTGQEIDRTEALWYAIVGIANAAGIPLIDAMAQPFAARGEG